MFFGCWLWWCWVSFFQTCLILWFFTCEWSFSKPSKIRPVLTLISPPRDSEKALRLGVLDSDSFLCWFCVEWMGCQLGFMVGYKCVSKKRRNNCENVSQWVLYTYRITDIMIEKSRRCFFFSSRKRQVNLAEKLRSESVFWTENDGDTSTPLLSFGNAADWNIKWARPSRLCWVFDNMCSMTMLQTSHNDKGVQILQQFISFSLNPN